MDKPSKKRKTSNSNSSGNFFVVIVLIVIGGIIYFVLQGSDDTASSSRSGSKSVKKSSSSGGGSSTSDDKGSSTSDDSGSSTSDNSGSSTGNDTKVSSTPPQNTSTGQRYNQQPPRTEYNQQPPSSFKRLYSGPQTNKISLSQKTPTPIRYVQRGPNDYVAVTEDNKEYTKEYPKQGTLYNPQGTGQYNQQQSGQNPQGTGQYPSGQYKSGGQYNPQGTGQYNPQGTGQYNQQQPGQNPQIGQNPQGTGQYNQQQPGQNPQGTGGKSPATNQQPPSNQQEPPAEKGPVEKGLTRFTSYICSGVFKVNEDALNKKTAPTKPEDAFAQKFYQGFNRQLEAGGGMELSYYKEGPKDRILLQNQTMEIVFDSCPGDLYPWQSNIRFQDAADTFDVKMFLVDINQNPNQPNVNQNQNQPATNQNQPNVNQNQKGRTESYLLDCNTQKMYPITPETQQLLMKDWENITMFCKVLNNLEQDNKDKANKTVPPKK